LNECVTEERRIHVTFVMSADSGVSTKNDWPRFTVAGALEIVGRAPRKR
jgi:hypothetical protein